MNILGISDVTGNHSHSSIALLQDGKLTFALSQERLSGIKNDNAFPSQAIGAALEYSGLTLEQIDLFACGYPPANYYASLQSHHFLDLPRSLLNVFFHNPLDLCRYLFPNIKKGLFDPKATNGLLKLGVPADKFHFIDHHLAHVSAAFMSSPFDECIGISYGGFAPHINGQNVAGAVYRCRNDKIELLEDIPMFATGCYYSGISVALGFKYMEQEGKTMALAGLGDEHECIQELQAITPCFDGKWHAYSHWIDYIMSPRKTVFLATKSGRRLLQLIEKHSPQNVAAAAQKLWHDNIIKFIEHLFQKYQTKNLVLTGGVFLNAQINQALTTLTKNLFIHPHTGDGSTTIGAMIELEPQKKRIDLTDTGLGIEYTDAFIEKQIMGFQDKISVTKIKDIPCYTAERLAQGKIIGWFQGREEYGPRATSHRCILADPRINGIKTKINKLKNRESFLPIGCSCLDEYGGDLFEKYLTNVHMTMVFKLKPKSDFFNVAHKDGTLRVGAITKNSYKPFRKLLEHFYTLTKAPFILNSSLNKHGDPIVHSPKAAINILFSTELSELVIGSFSIQKK